MGAPGVKVIGRAPATDLGPGWHIETIESAAALTAVAEEWDGLFRLAGEGLPFATHVWAKEWWAHLARKQALVRDSLRIQLVRDRTGSLVGIAPLILTEWPSAGPFRLRGLQLLGADANITELRRFLVKPEREADVLAACREYWLARPTEWDWTRLTGLRMGGDALAAVEQEREVRWSRNIEAFVLGLPGSWDEFRSGLKRNIRESLRKCYNSLARDQHAFELKVAETPDEVDRALGLTFDLHRRRAALQGTVSHRDYFADRSVRTFLRTVCQEFARQRAARVLMLSVGSRVVASRIAFFFGDQMYLYYSGFDPAWGQYSVMTTTVAEGIKYAIGVGVRKVHLSTGRDVSKTRWSPEEITYRDATLVSPSPRARRAIWIMDRIRATESFLRHRGLRG